MPIELNDGLCHHRVSGTPETGTTGNGVETGWRHGGDGVETGWRGTTRRVKERKFRTNRTRVVVVVVLAPSRSRVARRRRTRTYRDHCACDVFAMHSAQLRPSTAVRGLSLARPAMPLRRSRSSVITRAVSEPSSSVPFTASASHLNDWTPESWRDFPALQQPNYPDEEALRAAVGEIRRMPPLVFAGETRTLQDRLAAAARGEAFLVQGGDCAESFEQFSTNKVRDLYRLLLQMSVVVQYGGGMPVVKIARLAGTSCGDWVVSGWLRVDLRENCGLRWLRVRAEY